MTGKPAVIVIVRGVALAGYFSVRMDNIVFEIKTKQGFHIFPESSGSGCERTMALSWVEAHSMSLCKRLHTTGPHASM